MNVPDQSTRSGTYSHLSQAEIARTPSCWRSAACGRRWREAPRSMTTSASAMTLRRCFCATSAETARPTCWARCPMRSTSSTRQCWVRWIFRRIVRLSTPVVSPRIAATMLNPCTHAPSSSTTLLSLSGSLPVTLCLVCVANRPHWAGTAGGALFHRDGAGGGGRPAVGGGRHRCLRRAHEPQRPQLCRELRGDGGSAPRQCWYSSALSWCLRF